MLVRALEWLTDDVGLQRLTRYQTNSSSSEQVQLWCVQWKEALDGPIKVSRTMNCEKFRYGWEERTSECTHILEVLLCLQGNVYLRLVTAPPRLQKTTNTEKAFLIMHTRYSVIRHADINTSTATTITLDVRIDYLTMIIFAIQQICSMSFNVYHSKTSPKRGRKPRAAK